MKRLTARTIKLTGKISWQLVGKVLEPVGKGDRLKIVGWFEHNSCGEIETFPLLRRARGKSLGIGMATFPAGEDGFVTFTVEGTFIITPKILREVRWTHGHGGNMISFDGFYETRPDPDYKEPEPKSLLRRIFG